MLIRPKALLLIAAVPAVAYCQPPLNGNDFACFTNRWVANEPYATGFDGNPAATANDFQAFMDAFARGLASANCDGSGAGWTPLPLQPGALALYVSAGGTGTACTAAQPCSQSEGLSRLRQGHPDHLYLKAGDTFGSMTLTKGSGTSGPPMVIGVWGASVAVPRARVRTTGIAITIDDVQGLAIIDLDVRPSGGSAQNGLWMAEGSSDILVEGCWFSNFGVNVATHAINPSGRIDRFKFRRNITVDADGLTPQGGHGLFCGEQYGLEVIENVFDMCGRTGEQNIFRHSAYLSDSNGNAGPSTVIGNIHADSCADSIQVRTGGTVIDNLSLRNPTGMTTGGGVFSFNVAIDGRDINSTDRRGIAYSLSGNLTARYNIAAHQATGTQAITAFDMNGMSGLMFGNYVYDWKAPGGQGWATACEWNGGGGNVLCDSNRFAMPNIGMLWRHESAAFGPRFTYRNNSLYTTTPDGGVGGYLPCSRASGDGETRVQWIGLTGEPSATWTAAPPNPHITVADYLAFHQVSPGQDPVRTLMVLARGNSRMNWDIRWTGPEFNAWARGRVGGMPVRP